MDRLNLCDFGIRPGMDDDASPAFAVVLAACREQRVSHLRIEPGIYHIRNARAEALMQRVLNGELGHNPEPAMFHPNHRDYAIGVDASGLRDVRIEAEGAVLICHGFMEPLRLTGCRRVEVFGLTIDHHRQPFSVAEIVETAKDHCDVRLLHGYDLPGTTTAWIPGLVYDRTAGRLRPDRQLSGANTRLDSRTWRLHKSPDPKILGDLIAIRHTAHARPAILIEECDGVCLRDVTIHSQAGMGVVGHRSHDTTLTGLRVVPRPGAFISTNTDATHFSSCTGHLRYEGCCFSGHGDDAINVHTYYQNIAAVDGRRCTLAVNAPTGTHSQSLDHPDAGAFLELVDRRTLATVGRRRVVQAWPDPVAWRVLVELDEPLPPETADLLVADVSRLSQLTVHHCRFADHMARSVLVKTRHVLIEGCLFERSGNVAIHVAPEAHWREGCGAADVVIRHNRMMHCGRGRKPYGDACAIAVGVRAEDAQAVDIHQRIEIRGNLIIGDDAQHGINVANATGVSITDNHLAGCRNPIHVCHSRSVTVERNQEAPSCPIHNSPSSV